MIDSVIDSLINSTFCSRSDRAPLMRRASRISRSVSPWRRKYRVNGPMLMLAGMSPVLQSHEPIWGSERGREDLVLNPCARTLPRGSSAFIVVMMSPTVIFDGGRPQYDRVLLAYSLHDCAVDASTAISAPSFSPFPVTREVVTVLMPRLDK